MKSVNAVQPGNRIWDSVETEVVSVGGGIMRGTTPRQGVGALAGALGMTLMVAAAILVAGLPIALSARVFIEAIGWLTGFDLK